MYSASAETVLGIAAFQTNYIEPLIIKLKDKLFPPSQKTLDKRLAGYMSVYLFGLTGALGIMKDALKKGANPNTVADRINSEWEKIGTEPLLTKAVRFNARPLVELLLTAGAEINATDSEGKTALDTAQRGGRSLIGLLTENGGQTTTPPEAPARRSAFSNAPGAPFNDHAVKPALPENAPPKRPPGDRPSQKLC